MSNEVICFANIHFRGLTKGLLLREDSGLKIICTVNAEYIVRANRDPAFCRFLSENWSTFDGQVPYLLAKIFCRRAHFEKISGSDFIYDICSYARENHKKVFLLGGHADSNAAAVRLLKTRFHIDMDGFSPEPMPLPFRDTLDRDIMSSISAHRPDFLLVGFGAQKQEYWIRDHVEQLRDCGVKWAMGVGGTFDFAAGRIRRAPPFIRRLGLEGVFRLVQEPRLDRVKRLAMSTLMFRYIWG